MNDLPKNLSSLSIWNRSQSKIKRPFEEKDRNTTLILKRYSKVAFRIVENVLNTNKLFQNQFNLEAKNS